MSSSRVTEMKKSLREEMLSNIRGWFEDHELQDVERFIATNDKNIQTAVDDMIEDHANCLEELDNREMDLVREYLFEHVLLPKIDSDGDNDNSSNED
jgi:hypothetical protein